MLPRVSKPHMPTYLPIAMIHDCLVNDRSDTLFLAASLYYGSLRATYPMASWSQTYFTSCTQIRGCSNVLTFNNNI